MACTVSQLKATSPVRLAWPPLPTPGGGPYNVKPCTVLPAAVAAVAAVAAAVAVAIGRKGRKVRGRRKGEPRGLRCLLQTSNESTHIVLICLFRT